MKILLTGHGNFRNRGCEAIVRGTAMIIRESIPQSGIVLQSRSLEYDIPYARENAIALDSIIPYERDTTQRWSRAWWRQRFRRRIQSGDMNIGAFLNIPVYQNYDVVVSIGGDNFTDDYGSPKFYFDSLVGARMAGAKTVIWGASIGPFRDGRKARRWKSVLDQVDLITVREPTSVDYLKSLGVSENVREVADPAFLLPTQPPQTDLTVEKGNGIVVGIGASALVTQYGRTLQDYVAANVEFIRYAVSAHKARICLVPHVFVHGATKANNDLATCGEIAALLPKSCPVTIMPPAWNACEIKHFISQCDYFIGARTHSTIASLSTYVPTISIGYSPKATGINRAIFGTDEYVISIKDLTRDSLIARFDRLLTNESEVRQQLKKTVPLLCSSARRAGEYLREIVN